jgi:hypothetical protein
MKTNKLTSVKRLSIGIGLALSFGNIITASPSFAQTCSYLNGVQYCSISKPTSPIPPQNSITPERQLQPVFSCNNIAGFNKNCTPQKELPRDILDPRKGLPKR